jgi:hypothetical protein
MSVNIELSIQGYFDMDVFYLNGSKVGEHKDQDILQGILDNLQQGEYIIGIAKGHIYDLNDFGEPIYTFTIEATNNVEYEFENNN